MPVVVVLPDGGPGADAGGVEPAVGFEPTTYRLQGGPVQAACTGSVPSMSERTACAQSVSDQAGRHRDHHRRPPDHPPGPSWCRSHSTDEHDGPVFHLATISLSDPARGRDHPGARRRHRPPRPHRDRDRHSKRLTHRRAGAADQPGTGRRSSTGSPPSRDGQQPPVSPSRWPGPGLGVARGLGGVRNRTRTARSRCSAVP